MNGSRRTSRTLSFWLRHAPEAAGLRLDSSGWADTEAVLAALNQAGLPSAPSYLERVVVENDKGRFEFSPSGERIRARQGHSIAVDAGWRVTPPPEFLYHGTVQRFLPSILVDGLIPKARHHVHLSPDVSIARAVGARRGDPVILAIAARALAEAGTEFLLSSNGVWLTRHVPPTHLRQL